MECVNCKQGKLVVYQNITFYNKHEIKEDTHLLYEPIRSRKWIETTVKCDLCRAEYEFYTSTRNDQKWVIVDTYYNKPRLKENHRSKTPKEEYTLEQIDSMIDISLQNKDKKEFNRLVKLREKLEK